MTLPTPLTLLGAPGSPYTRKMLAVLRYRRIPYKLILGSHREVRDLPKPKVELLPTFYLPNAEGVIEAVVDSTPLIRRLESEFPQRKIVPADPALAFLDYLLEDFADEWLTKAMFHYRWHFKADAEKGGEILPRWRVTPMREEALAPVKKFIAERQIARLYVVGSNDITAPVIEDSYKRYLQAMKNHLELHPFLFGARPASADFAAYGQLTQLARFDPTPEAIALAEAPRIYAWVDVVDDLSGLEPGEDDWLKAEVLPQTLKPILEEVGRVYVPVMLANAKALTEGRDSVECEVMGKAWTQQPFAYQGRCVTWLRQEYAALDGTARAAVDGALEGTGCAALFAS